MLDSLEFRKNVLSFVESMKDTKGPFWAYKLTKDSDYSVFSFCFSIFIKNMFGELTNIDKKVKSEWITFLQNLQDKNTGLFIDPESKSKATDSEHDSNHLNIQLTTFCVAALDCLDSSSRYPLKFVEEYYNPSYLNDWLGKLNWRRSSNSGNKVMFIAICLIYNYERFGIRKAKLALDVWFMWMDKNQNSKTGFWSIDTNGGYMQGMSGFYHQFVIYMYMDRQVQYQSKLVDKLLFIQQPDGLFYPGNGGGSCYDIDGITPLIYFYKNNNYRRNEIKEALGRALDSILFNQQNDGGFVGLKENMGTFQRINICLVIYFTNMIYFIGILESGDL